LIVLVNGVVLAAHLDCDREIILGYVTKGIIEKLASGKYDLDKCRNRVLAYLREKAAGRSGDLTNERALLAKEQRDALVFKNALIRGDFVSLETIKKILIAMLAVIRERLLTIPGKMADACEMRLRAEIEAILRTEIIETLNELHDPDHIIGGAGGRSDSAGSAVHRPQATAKPQPD
jgi:phage terminase Nu1 subunit (DNA packaging protein)